MKLNTWSFGYEDITLVILAIQLFKPLNISIPMLGTSQPMFPQPFRAAGPNSIGRWPYEK